MPQERLVSCLGNLRLVVLQDILHELIRKIWNVRHGTFQLLLASESSPATSQGVVCKGTS